MDTTKTIFIVDDNAHFRKTIKEFLESTKSLKVIGESSNGLEFLKKIISFNPDLIIMDVFMPVMDGIVAAKNRLKQLPTEKIIALTMHVGPVYTKLIADAGIRGCVIKDNLYKELTLAIRTVLNNGYFFGGVPSDNPPVTN